MRSTILYRIMETLTAKYAYWIPVVQDGYPLTYSLFINDNGSVIACTNVYPKKKRFLHERETYLGKVYQYVGNQDSTEYEISESYRKASSCNFIKLTNVSFYTFQLGGYAHAWNYRYGTKEYETKNYYDFKGAFDNLIYSVQALTIEPGKTLDQAIYKYVGLVRVSYYNKNFSQIVIT